ASWAEQLAQPRARVVRHGRATTLAEGAAQLRRRLEACDPLAASDVAEVTGITRDARRERRPVRLAAARAVAMGHEVERPVDLPRHITAETAAVNRHDSLPRPGDFQSPYSPSARHVYKPVVVDDGRRRAPPSICSNSTGT